jgi:hypothetical protein
VSAPFARSCLSGRVGVKETEMLIKKLRLEKQIFTAENQESATEE